jgi:hypothetical protein
MNASSFPGKNQVSEGEVARPDTAVAQRPPGELVADRRLQTAVAPFTTEDRTTAGSDRRALDRSLADALSQQDAHGESGHRTGRAEQDRWFRGAFGGLAELDVSAHPGVSLIRREQRPSLFLVVDEKGLLGTHMHFIGRWVVDNEAHRQQSGSSDVEAKDFPGLLCVGEGLRQELHSGKLDVGRPRGGQGNGCNGVSMARAAAQQGDEQCCGDRGPHRVGKSPMDSGRRKLRHPDLLRSPRRAWSMALRADAGLRSSVRRRARSARKSAILSFLRTRMGLIINPRQVLEVQMGVDLGGTDVGVSQKLLYGPQVAARFQ